MPTKHLLLSLLATVAACTDASTAATDHAETEVIRPTRPLVMKLSPTGAASLCEGVTHAPTLVEAQQQLFHDCAAVGDGFACVPAGTATEIEDAFWTTTPCVTAGQQGFFLADLGTGEITCTRVLEAAVQPLCIH